MNGKYLNKVNVNSSRRLVLFSLIINDNCPKFKSVCNLFMTIESLNIKNEATIEIGINYQKDSKINEIFVFPHSTPHSDDSNNSDEPFNNETNQDSSNSDNSSKDSSKKKLIIIIISISVVSFIIICILVISLIIVYKKKVQYYNEKLNAISFKEEDSPILNE